MFSTISVHNLCITCRPPSLTHRFSCPLVLDHSPGQFWNCAYSKGFLGPGRSPLLPRPVIPALSELVINIGNLHRRPQVRKSMTAWSGTLQGNSGANRFPIIRRSSLFRPSLHVGGPMKCSYLQSLPYRTHGHGVFSLDFRGEFAYPNSPCGPLTQAGRVSAF